MKRYRLFAALLIPFALLISLAAYRIYNLRVGRAIIFEISGYDPRDILAGHYLTYRVDYGLKNGCSGVYEERGCVCFTKLEPPEGAFVSGCKIEGKGCLMFIKGGCEYDRFESGIERLYISDEKSGEYDKKLRKEGARLKAVVTPDGVPSAVDLMWKE